MVTALADDMDWARHAACRGLTHLFYPDPPNVDEYLFVAHVNGVPAIVYWNLTSEDLFYGFIRTDGFAWAEYREHDSALSVAPDELLELLGF